MIVSYYVRNHKIVDIGSTEFKFGLWQSPIKRRGV